MPRETKSGVSRETGGTSEETIRKSAVLNEMRNATRGGCDASRVAYAWHSANFPSSGSLVQIGPYLCYFVDVTLSDHDPVLPNVFYLRMVRESKRRARESSEEEVEEASSESSENDDEEESEEEEAPDLMVCAFGSFHHEGFESR